MGECGYQHIDEKKEKLPEFTRIPVMETTLIHSE
jgi:hypothetical protein